MRRTGDKPLFEQQAQAWCSASIWRRHRKIINDTMQFVFCDNNYNMIIDIQNVLSC